MADADGASRFLDVLLGEQRCNRASSFLRSYFAPWPFI
jgi:hypothetical protein